MEADADSRARTLLKHNSQQQVESGWSQIGAGEGRGGIEVMLRAGGGEGEREGGEGGRGEGNGGGMGRVGRAWGRGFCTGILSWDDSKEKCEIPGLNTIYLQYSIYYSFFPSFATQPR